MLLSALQEQTPYTVPVPLGLLSFLCCRKALNFTVRTLSEVFPGLEKHTLASLCNLCVVPVVHSQQNLFCLCQNGA